MSNEFPELVREVIDPIAPARLKGRKLRITMNAETRMLQFKIDMPEDPTPSLLLRP